MDNIFAIFINIGINPNFWQAPIPNLLPNQLRIKIYASSITDNDLKIKNGFYKGKLPKVSSTTPSNNFVHLFSVPLPVAAGTDISGVIEQIGSQVSEDFKVGEEVSGWKLRIWVSVLVLIFFNRNYSGRHWRRFIRIYFNRAVLFRYVVFAKRSGRLLHSNDSSYVHLILY